MELKSETGNQHMQNKKAIEFIDSALYTQLISWLERQLTSCYCAVVSLSNEFIDGYT